MIWFFFSLLFSLWLSLSLSSSIFMHCWSFSFRPYIVSLHFHWMCLFFQFPIKNNYFLWIHSLPIKLLKLFVFFLAFFHFLYWIDVNNPGTWWTSMQINIGRFVNCCVVPHTYIYNFILFPFIIFFIFYFVYYPISMYF